MKDHTDQSPPWPEEAMGEEGLDEIQTHDQDSDLDNPQSEEEVQEENEGLVTQESYDALMHQYTRLLADFDNYKRRVKRDQADILAYANAGLVEDLLPVLDTLEMAISAVSEDADDTLLAYAQGNEKILKQFFEILAKAGLEKIEADGLPFDPQFHEAVMMVASDDVPGQHIAEVLRPGYTFKDRVLRPTVCKVAQD